MTSRLLRVVKKVGIGIIEAIRKTDAREIVLREKEAEIERLKKQWPGMDQPQMFRFGSPRPKGDLDDDDGGEIVQDVMRFNKGGVEVALGGLPDEYEKELPPEGRGRRRLAPPSKATEKLRMTDEAFMHRLVEMYTRGWLGCMRSAGVVTEEKEEEVVRLGEVEARDLFQKILRGQA